MYEDTVVSFSHPDRISIEDPLTEVLQAGARRLLAEAVEVEVSAFIAEHADPVDGSGLGPIVEPATCAAPRPWTLATKFAAC